MRNQWSTRTVYSMMKTFAIALLCALLAGCATPVPSSTPTDPPSPMSVLTPSALSPSPSASIVFVCLPITSGPGVSSLPPNYCSDLYSEGAILTGVAGLGLPVKTITIVPFDLSCGGPFPSGTFACPVATDPLPTAYVTFVGTDKVAAVEIGTVTGGPGIAKIVVFEVPPAGWSMPAP